MPRSEVIFYKEDEAVLVREWLKLLPIKAQKTCLTLSHKSKFRVTNCAVPFSCGMASMNCGLPIRAFIAAF